eukprot:CAMPEP_0194374322 /NCGR_PEP_ID=MMETSP0174-20130528/22726_1 /TAXON_ID=216777 /ORGANISM="Proboscia alata, Strain PI-D3" /LENGTH=71 /DNA_ID=CAMNT_0039153825 /DNA_START=1 /DNA_END=212 /DNA_ORIENTATION=+
MTTLRCKNQSYSLAYSNAIPDLTDGEILVRIKYVPRFDETYLEKPSFMSSPHAMHYFENSDYPNGGLADFG